MNNHVRGNDVRNEGFSMANASTFEDPGALSGPLAGVSFVGGLATGLSLADAPFPLPGADVKAIQRFFLGSAGPERINVAGQLISAASLAQFSVSVARLAGRVGRGSKALRAAAIAGGALATASLAASAAAAAALTAAPGATRTGPGCCTAWCSARVGRCMAPGWHCCWARLAWPGCAPGLYRGRWRWQV